ncbi:hypothetical protein BACUNI_00577 [Bacteroides uniformis ATCC 8492]|uniref:Uncharacterized protein n=1 Tax=Bacteroides uniformis (strain ATCC 8492 / DSM 6597 / CCUG 4942 / CIP 103695 / JCM 5828 / KCTC 5204 / NCTC 13054 / VPI 0061) TaxID=411479 RepID=A0ABC9NG65_BACUC|nr:hypothetical protein BACUNI_00577 [Bacteroides uniformis ATCC 8492]
MVCTTVTDGLFESDGWSVLLQRTIRSIFFVITSSPE